MARGTIGSRRITIDGQDFLWRVPRALVGEDQGLGWAPLSFTVWRADGAAAVRGTLLEGEAAGARPDNWLHARSVVLTPARVSSLIRQAIAAGWEPSLPGKAFRFQETN